MAYRTEITTKFKLYWPNYIWQIALAMLILFVIVIALGKEKIVTISSMGATAFVVLAMPKSVSAKTRNVVCGHLVGLACGALFFYIAMPYWAEYPLAVGLTMFLMVTLDVEHPPAAGTALAVVISEISLNAFVTIMLTAIILTQFRHHLKKHLKDLV